MLEINHDAFKKAIHKSQHCQRNWDLTKQIPEQDLDVLMTAVKECPSKQNVAHYNAYFVTNREIIEKIHDATNGFELSYDPLTMTTNTQVLANLLVIFEPIPVRLQSERDRYRNTQIKEFSESADEPAAELSMLLERDRNMAIGVAAGYLNLSASLLGYATGCCACFDPNAIKEILQLEAEPALLMGVGFRNVDVSRRAHHKNSGILFPANPKQPIQVKTIS